MNITIIKLLLMLTILPSVTIGADDYVLGRYEHIDKLSVSTDTWHGEVKGEGKYVAGFIECFYDNVSENYRKNPTMRAKVLAQMEDAKKSGEKRFSLYQDEHFLAWKETTGIYD